MNSYRTALRNLSLIFYLMLCIGCASKVSSPGNKASPPQNKIEQNHYAYKISQPLTSVIGNVDNALSIPAQLKHKDKLFFPDKIEWQDGKYKSQYISYGKSYMGDSIIYKMNQFQGVFFFVDENKKWHFPMYELTLTRTQTNSTSVVLSGYISIADKLVCCGPHGKYYEYRDINIPPAQAEKVIRYLQVFMPSLRAI